MHSFTPDGRHVRTVEACGLTTVEVEPEGTIVEGTRPLLRAAASVCELCLDAAGCLCGMGECRCTCGRCYANRN